VKKVPWLFALISFLSMGLLAAGGGGKTPPLRRTSYLDLVASFTRSIPAIDGEMERVWEEATPLRVKTFPIKKFGNRRLMEVELRALYTAQEFFLLARWRDPTESLEYKPWVFDGKEWHEEREIADDAFAINWNIGSRLFPLIGCRAFCHLSNYPDIDGLSPHDMWTEKSGMTADHWEWRAAETAPFRWVKDGRITYIDFEKFVNERPGEKPVGRSPDGLTRSPDIFEFNLNPATEDRPMYAPNPRAGADPHAPYIRVTGPESIVPIEGIPFKAGDRVAGILLPPEVPPEMRGHVEGVGRYAGGVWTLELKRQLRTGDPDDVQFYPARGEDYFFGIAVFDASVYHNYSDVIRLVFRQPGAESAGERRALAPITRPVSLPRSPVTKIGDASRGRVIFGIQCVVCHGEEGRGDGPTAASLDPRPRDFQDSRIMGARTDQDLVTVILDGGPAAGKSSLMPPWEGILDEQEIQDVVAYIRSLGRKEAGSR
jgi:mono/diheme cytochrome c family protein